MRSNWKDKCKYINKLRQLRLCAETPSYHKKTNKEEYKDVWLLEWLLFPFHYS